MRCSGRTQTSISAPSLRSHADLPPPFANATRRPQAALLKRAKANSLAQQGLYDASGEGKEAAAGMYEKGYVY